MIHKYTGFYKFQLGYIYIFASQNYITKINITLSPIENFQPNENQLIKKLLDLLDDYFNGKKVKFDIPFSLTDMPYFTKKALITLYNNISYGQIITYKKLAELCGQKKAYRAVGNAMAKNPIPIIIPCHRVIKTDGSLGKYSGGGLIIKKFLLKLEKAIA